VATTFATTGQKGSTLEVTNTIDLRPPPLSRSRYSEHRYADLGTRVAAGWRIWTAPPFNDPKASVVLRLGNNIAGTSKISIDGSFEFTNVASGGYSLSLSDPDSHFPQSFQYVWKASTSGYYDDYSLTKAGQRTDDSRWKRTTAPGSPAAQAGERSSRESSYKALSRPDL
jgi:hypothetical protein